MELIPSIISVMAAPNRPSFSTLTNAQPSSRIPIESLEVYERFRRMSSSGVLFWCPLAMADDACNGILPCAPIHHCLPPSAPEIGPRDPCHENLSQFLPCIPEIQFVDEVLSKHSAPSNLPRMLENVWNIILSISFDLSSPDHNLTTTSQEIDEP